MSSGLSPRGRGNPCPRPPHTGHHRSIPAWAGEPLDQTSLTQTWTVYPRVGGGTARPDQPHANLDGLSPRGRGNRSTRPASRKPGRSIPAWAGEPINAPSTASRCAVYPRVGGGTPDVRMYSEPSSGLSPRGRGNLRRLAHPGADDRSIPAWAGEPWSPGRTARSRAVYPRVGGGTAASSILS